MNKMVKKQKEWYKSKGKWGAGLLMLGALLSGLGGYLDGQLSLDLLLKQILPLFAGGLGLYGVRDKQDRQ